VEESRLAVLRSPSATLINNLHLMKASLLGHCREVSTRRTYGIYQKHFIKFANKHSLEWNEEAALLFITNWFCQRKSYSGCKQARFAIAALYSDNGIDCLKNSERLIKLLVACEKFSEIPNTRKRDPFPVHLLLALASKKPESWSHNLWWMIRCLISIGLRTMARGSELCALRKSDISIISDNEIVVHFARTKTKKQGRKVRIYASGRVSCPVRSTIEWLKRAPLNSALLFSNGSCQLSTNIITYYLRMVAREFSCSGQFSSHSLRIGGASALTFGGYSKEQIMAIGDWNSDAIDRYLRESIDHNLNITSDMLL